MRYQGDTAGPIEIEGRCAINPRWAAVAFYGCGLRGLGGIVDSH